MAQTDYDMAFVMKLETRRIDAMLSNNVTRLGPLLDEELVYIHSSAVKDSRQEYLDSIAEGRLAYRGARPTYDPIVGLGERAFLLTGRIELDIELSGRPVALDNLFIAVWKLGNGDEWRLVSWQSTPFPTSASAHE